ncbi:MAG: CAP domain-containing protein [Myxococcota bacterium]
MGATLKAHGWIVMMAGLVGCYAGADEDSATETSGESSGVTSAGPAGGPGGGPAGDPGGGPDSTQSGSAESGSADTDGPGPGSSDGPTSGEPGDESSGSSGDSPDPNEVEQMCRRWTADRANMNEGNWSGSVAACDPGDISAEGRANALRLVNLHRWLVGLPEVTTDPSRDSMAQACALMMHANGSLSHNPPMGWNCYSGDGATAAGSSNISTGPGVMSVDLYMVDPGNATTLGHRRWILSNSAGPVGLGSTSDYSCMWVLGGSGVGNNEWTAWPSPGPFPFEAISPLGFASLDETGWSVQSDTIDLNGASVTITAGGEARPVTVTNLAAGYGSGWAISMVPQGWTAQPDTTYHVRVEGIPGGAIEYDVQIVACG